MRILISCEFSGLVRDAFIARGHDAVSCDLRPTERPGPHIVGDVRDVIDDRWDMMIAFPPCTFLCRAGLHWNIGNAERQVATEKALEFVALHLNADIKKIALENPMGCISTRIRPADQYIQPYHFGDDLSKVTGLWLKNLSPLRPTGYAIPRAVDATQFDLLGHPIDGKLRWANQTDSGQNNEPDSKGREKRRSEISRGLANAMAEQWGR